MSKKEMNETLDTFAHKNVRNGPLREEISMKFIGTWSNKIWSDLNLLKHGSNTREFWVYYKFAGQYRFSEKSAFLFKRMVTFEKCFPSNRFPPRWADWHNTTFKLVSRAEIKGDWFNHLASARHYRFRCKMVALSSNPNVHPIKYLGYIYYFRQPIQWLA